MIMSSTIKTCKRCGFILGTRPNLTDKDGVCSACINHDKKKLVDFKSRQKWLTTYISDNKTNPKYDCIVAFSGGKDSTVIVKKLFENHGVKKILLVYSTDEFTHTKTGGHNIDNVLNRYDCDLLTFRLNPGEHIEHMRQDFIETLNPLKWSESQIEKIPLEIARNYNIRIVFYGENDEYEYGSENSLDILHKSSDDDLKIIYLGAVYPYSEYLWYKEAVDIGFWDLNHLNEWQRQGLLENYSAINSVGYHIGPWTKFVKFGFQRVSDIACRKVRNGLLSLEQAKQHIKDLDWICDPASKRDFCRTLAITESFFDETVDKHANRDIVTKDANGIWKRIDLTL